jgi:hypothetical protein
MNEIKKISIALFVGMCLSTMGAAGKAFIDVERLKVNVNNVYENIKEIKEDLKEIKRLLLYKKGE